MRHLDVARMADQLIIEHLEFQGHCGVTESERLVPQPIAVDLIVDYPEAAMEAIADRDDITHAVDYATIAQRAMEVGTSQPFHLLETLADRLTRMLFSEFAVARVQLWVRKVGAAVKGVEGSVGVRIDRSQPVTLSGSEPAAFLKETLPLLPPGRVLDLASGSGRHALYLARQGFHVHAIDRDAAALSTLAAEARRQTLAHITTQQLDLEADPHHPTDLGNEAYDVIVVFFYLYRPIAPLLLRALKPGGVLVYETFLIDNHLRHNHPRRREFCLAHNELLTLTRGLRVLRYEEGGRTRQGTDPAVFTARLVAQKEGLDGSP